MEWVCGSERLLHGRTWHRQRKYRSFVKFDLSGLTAATILSAELKVDITNTQSAVTVTRMGTDTWGVWFNGINSPLPYYSGESFISHLGMTGWTRPQETTFDASTIGVKTIDITSWVQYWQANPSENYGLAFWINGTGDAAYAVSGETAPVITVTQEAVPEPATMSLLVLGGLGVLVKRRRR